MAAALALALLAAHAHAAPPGVTLHWNTTNRMNKGAAQDSALHNFGRTDSVAACGALCVAWQPGADAAQRCRSFTRFADTYSSNISLAGQCFGRLDPSWVPLEATGEDAADSGTVEWPCADSLDCSLNGKCAAGTCACNKGWKGRRCEMLNLVPVDADVLGFNPT